MISHELSTTAAGFGPFEKLPSTTSATWLLMNNHIHLIERFAGYFVYITSKHSIPHSNLGLLDLDFAFILLTVPTRHPFCRLVGRSIALTTPPSQEVKLWLLCSCCSLSLTTASLGSSAKDFVNVEEDDPWPY